MLLSQNHHPDWPFLRSHDVQDVICPSSPPGKRLRLRPVLERTYSPPVPSGPQVHRLILTNVYLPSSSVLLRFSPMASQTCSSFLFRPPFKLTVTETAGGAVYRWPRAQCKVDQDLWQGSVSVWAGQDAFSGAFFVSPTYFVVMSDCFS